jgi:hypothetical protein
MKQMYMGLLLLSTGGVVAISDCQIALNAWNEMGGNFPYAPTPVNCCGNSGITCSYGSITGLIWSVSSFSQNQFISSSISSLPMLTSLSLSGFNLSMIPTFILSMVKLQSLSVVRCGLQGQIPADLGLLNQLKYLDLSSNQLSGNIPCALKNLTKLREL